MDKSENLKKAVILTEGDCLRAVATWRTVDENVAGQEDPVPRLSLASIELEMKGSDAMGNPRWENYGQVVAAGGPVGNAWLAHFLIACAERWQKENL